ncbi:hypothetical protein TELCIR_21734 [Teladorsagia circumcincta]|uniref:Uncharacterized protein n=1 Tax=Teladorsagia circumcincta TaxID=45464 RepID=A0A2G9TFY9_TELCI|nr:hypothetical protein TELCIR_21734 [Teladorsagia circumcincta]
MNKKKIMRRSKINFSRNFEVTSAVDHLSTKCEEGQAGFASRFHVGILRRDIPMITPNLKKRPREAISQFPPLARNAPLCI